MTTTARPAQPAPPAAPQPPAAERASKGMTRLERNANLAGVVVPFVGVLVEIVLLWNRWVDATDLVLTCKAKDSP